MKLKTVLLCNVIISLYHVLEVMKTKTKLTISVFGLAFLKVLTSFEYLILYLSMLLLAAFCLCVFFFFFFFMCKTWLLYPIFLGLRF